MREYTKRRNVNRGYMKLDVWQEAMELFRMTNEILKSAVNVEFKLRGQILDAVQSISSNISEGYCRRSINEYLYYLNISLGSLGESLTRMIGLQITGKVNTDHFEKFDTLHYSIENKLLALIKSLQTKRNTNDWIEEIREPDADYNVQQNTNKKSTNEGDSGVME